MESTQSHRALILEAYKKHVLLEGAPPASIYKFCNQLGIRESDFYAEFASFETIDKTVWRTYLDTTIARLGDDANFGAFTVREKVLAFYFTLSEELKADRSYVLGTLQAWQPKMLVPVFLKDFRHGFQDWFSMVLLEGKQTGEVANRPFLDQQYGSLFWMHFLFILQFWRNDDSAGFEKTDIAIEKSVNLAFDLIGKGVLDGALDFGKFLYQQTK
jgi:hypothetical protein